MDPSMIDRLERSFNALAPKAPELADRFYALLFSRNPGVRPMFPESMNQQKKKLLASLMLVVQNLRTPEKLTEPLKEMGARHVGYGTEPEHYPIVRDTLVEVMGEMAGDLWNAQLEADWKGALDLVAGIMLEGAANAAHATAD
ncbi:MAG: globin domain-containing protein [Phycisphaerae bacterium]